MFGNNSGGSGFSFGSNTAQKPALTFGGTQNNASTGSQPAAGGGLFGGNNPASTGSTGLFGNNSGNSTGLTSNTSNSGGLFGQNNSTASKPGFSFGNTNQSNTTGSTGSTGFSFGANPNTQNTAQTGQQPAAASGGLFGANNTAGQTSNTGFSFGGANNNTNSNTSTGLFGNKPGGLFGQSSTTNTQPGLFGSGSNQQSTSGGLFGSNQQTNSGGLFGSNQQSNTGGLFGSNQQNNTGGLFGQQNNNNTGTSGGLFGNQQQNNTAQSQVPPLNPITKVSDLPEAFQKELEQLDQYIQTQVAIAERLKNDEDVHKELISSIPRDIDFLEKRYFSTNQALNSDLEFVGGFKNKTLESFDNWVEKLIKVYLQLTNPMLLGVSSNSDQTKSTDGTITQIIGVNGIRTAGSIQSQQGNSQQQLEKDSHVNVPQILNSYYLSKIEEFRQNIDKYQLVLQEVENSVNDLDRSSLSGGPSGAYGLETIVSTLKEEFKLFVELANEFAEVHHQVKRLDDGSI
ncbi:hypothetical protein OGAPHI_002107 [Ogataea philodendri]|uniref:Nucleoporin NUP49/NSP49 n=1 Tax=Ogataea philodendri TaxID=1378263 RepID=A0A9P8PA17_9ASCO|nr:uncharacterized protein OGAPHI_002107 [Ogataea philodendri]KAH3668353.1 hypothetical protein OGAPHI_002107 [Ogataea philodendri]